MGLILQVKVKLKHEQCYHDFLTDEDRALIDDIVTAYESTSIKVKNTYTMVSHKTFHNHVG